MRALAGQIPWTTVLVLGLFATVAAGVAAGDGVVAVQGANETDDGAERVGIDDLPLDEPGLYSVDVSNVSQVELTVAGPGGGGAGHDNGGAGDGGDGGLVEGLFDVAAFDELVVTVGEGGGGGSPDGGGAGGDGFYAGGDGGLEDGFSGFHSAGGGGGGATVVEGVGETTVPLAAGGGGGGGSAYDTYVGGSDNTGGGGGAAGGTGGTAEGGAIGGGTDGDDAEESEVVGVIGGDGADSEPSDAADGADGAAWVNDEYVTGSASTTGGGGEGGPGGGESGGDGADGSVEIAQPDIVLDSLAFPETVGPGEDLTVEYTLANTGEIDGTESAVELLVDGAVADTDTDVTVGAGETVDGTLTFDGVDEFDDGDTIAFTVALAEFGDTADGETLVETPELALGGIEFPAVVEPDEPIVVEYVVENTGSEPGTESAVELLVDDAVADTDTNVTVDPGETADGTLTLGADEFDDGDTVAFTVALAEFGDTANGTTDVTDPGEGPALVVVGVDAPESVPPGGDLTVAYTVENIGDEAGTESAVELLVDDAVADTDTDVTVEAGETVSGTLTATGGFEPGETIAWTVELSTFEDAASGETDVLTAGSVNLAVEPESAVVDPGETESYEVVVEGADAGILGYDGLVVEVTDPAVGNITGFEENIGGEGAFSNSEIQQSGAALSLEAAAGTAFVDPGPEAVIATFDVEAVGEAGETTGLSFDTGATLADFESGEAYTVEMFDDGTLVLDAGEGPNLAVTGADAPDEIEIDESLTVEYTLENFGDETGTESAVTLLVGGEAVDADQNVTVSDDGIESGTLVFDGVEESYEEGETITWTVELSTFDDSETGETTIAGAESPPAFVVTGVETDAPVIEGETLNVTVTVENTGGPGTQTVETGIDGIDTDSETLELGADEAGEVEFELETEVGDAGEHDLKVVAGNHSTTETVELQLPAVTGNPPRDLTGDGGYEDVRGTGEFTIFDVQTLFTHLDDPAIQDHAWAYDFTESGDVGILDVQALFNKLT